MSNNRSGSDDGASAAAPFKQWLERQATEEGISQEQLFEQLVSSYWTLNEMEQLLAGSDSESLSVEPPSEDSRGQDREITERLDTLEERLEAEVERRQSLDPLVETLANRLTDVEGGLEELATEIETVDSALDRKHESVTERIDVLEEGLEQERETRSAEQQELAAEQSRISSRLDSEFENLETILTYLVSRTDELEAGISDIDSKHEAALTRLRSERDALDSVKQAAADADVRTGECESCGEAINLGMLSRPYCPECEASLTGIEERQKWLFFSDVVVTTGGEGPARSPQTGDRSSRGEEHSQSATGEHSLGEPTPSGSNSRAGHEGRTPTGGKRGAESDAAESGADPNHTGSPSEGSGLGGADDTGWTDSRFQDPTVKEASSDDTSGPHDRTDTGSTWRDQARGGTRAADVDDKPRESEGKKQVEDDSDDTTSPFGDLSDLTTEE